MFTDLFMGIFNKHASLKFKVVKANNNPFMAKDLRKAIMKRSKLKNEFHKKRSYNSERAYKNQRNLCTYLLYIYIKERKEKLLQ